MPCQLAVRRAIERADPRERVLGLGVIGLGLFELAEPLIEADHPPAEDVLDELASLRARQSSGMWSSHLLR